MDDLLYLRKGMEIPAEYHVDRVVTVDALEKERVRHIQMDEPVDITASTDGGYRRYLPSETGTITLDSGQLARFHAALLPFAFAGGGEVVIAARNPLYDQPITQAEHDRREAEEAELDAIEYGEYADYLD